MQMSLLSVAWEDFFLVVAVRLLSMLSMPEVNDSCAESMGTYTPFVSLPNRILSYAILVHYHEACQ